MSLIDPAGPRATMTANLWWFILALGVGVYIAVMVVLVLSLTRAHIGERARMRLVIFGGIVAPALVLVVLLAADLRTLVAVAAPSGSPDLTIEVVGHQWWWEIRYPDQGISTAPEHLRRTITGDQGAEMANHVRFTLGCRLSHARGPGRVALGRKAAAFRLPKKLVMR